MKIKKISVGFTLAEVLITLGIIGIVAALTIPTLIKNYQQKAWNTSAEIFERKLDEALKMMNTNDDIAFNNSTENFVNKLSKYIKISKICDNNNLTDCFPDKFIGQIIDLDVCSTKADKVFNVSDFKLASDLKQTGNWSTNTMGIIFANGVSAILAYNDKNCKSEPFNSQFDGKSCFTMIYDTSGKAKPNSLNKDIRNINTKLSGNIKLSDKYWNLPTKTTTPLSIEECTKILGADRCFNNNDYWAGAVKTCGGTNNMPTTSDMLKLGKAMYSFDQMTQTSSVAYSCGTNKCIKNDVRNLLFPNESNDRIDIWLNNNYSDPHGENFALNAYFTSKSFVIFQEYTRNRTNSNIYTLCAIE